MTLTRKDLGLLLLAGVLIAASCASLHAQVKIGGDPSVPLTTGALLELGDATSAATGGLLLPLVTLTAENANPFGAGESTDLVDGLLVYNLGGAGNLDAGLYVLQSGLWKPAGSSGGGIPVAGVTITPNTPFSLGVGNTAPMDFSVYPPNATYPSMSWNSSDENVATVSNMGVVTGVAPGTSDISLTLGSVTSDPVTVTVVTCGQPFTAPSGKTYNTAAYSNANLSNLCWTTSNLQEAGQSATCWSNNCTTYPTRGYYYTVGGAADNACAALNSGGTAWRVPTGTEWAALQTAFPSLAAGVGTTGNTAALQADWNSGAAMAGHYYTSNSTWYNWDAAGYWWAQGTSGLLYYVNSGATTMYSGTNTNYWFTVRCVRSL